VATAGLVLGLLFHAVELDKVDPHASPHTSHMDTHTRPHTLITARTRMRHTLTT
jgi:hypothetical protein